MQYAIILGRASFFPVRYSATKPLRKSGDHATLRPPPNFGNVTFGGLTRHYGENTLGPGVEGLSFLVCPVVPLINSGNTAATATDVVQDGFGDFKSNAKTLQAGCERSP